MSNKQQFLINLQKAYGASWPDPLEKAAFGQKNFAKLKKVKKLVHKNGKTYYQTYYVSQEGETVGEPLDSHEMQSTQPHYHEAQVGHYVKFDTTNKHGHINGQLTNIYVGDKGKPTEYMYYSVFDHKHGKEVHATSHTVSNFKTSKTPFDGQSEVQDSQKKLAKEAAKGTGFSKQPKEDGFDNFEKGLEYVKTLPGYTSPQVFKHVASGKLYVQKKGISKEQLDSEHRAVMAASLLIPELTISPTHYNKAKGQMYTEYLPNAETLQQAFSGMAEHNKLEIKKYLAKGFVVQALLSNRDCVGNNLDNVIVDKGTGKIAFIDYGGAMGFTGVGKEKTSWLNGEPIVEDKTLLEPGINFNASMVFKGVVTDELIREQLKKIEPNVQEMYKILGLKDGQIFKQRFDELNQKYVISHEKLFKPDQTGDFPFDDKPDVPAQKPAKKAEVNIDEWTKPLKVEEHFPEAKALSTAQRAYYKDLSKALSVTKGDVEILKDLKNSGKLTGFLKVLANSFTEDGQLIDNPGIDKLAWYNDNNYVNFAKKNFMSMAETAAIVDYTGSHYSTFNEALVDIFEPELGGNILLDTPGQLKSAEFNKKIAQVYKDYKEDLDTFFGLMAAKMVVGGFMKAKNNNGANFQSQESVNYRHFGFIKNKVKNLYKVGEVVAFPRITSTSTDLKWYLKNPEAATVSAKFITKGLNVKPISHYKTENEILIKPFQPFEVLKAKEMSDFGKLNLYLAEP